MIKLVLVIFFWVPNLFGSHENDLEYKYLTQMEDQSKYAYSFVMKYCHNWDLAFSQMNKGSLYEIGNMIFNLNTLTASTRIRNNGKSIQLTHLLESSGYYLGLNHCFGNNQSAKDLFSINLIAGDLLGTTSGAAVGTLSWIGGSKMMKWLGTKVLPKTWIPKIKKGFYIILGTSAGGYIVMNLFQRINYHLEALEEKKLDAQEKRTMLTLVTSDISELQLMIDNNELSEKELDKVKDLILKLNTRVEKIEHDLAQSEQRS